MDIRVKEFDQILSKIQEHLSKGELVKVKKILTELDPADIADIIEDVPPTIGVVLFRLLPKDIAIEVFELIKGEAREKLLSCFTNKEVAELIMEMSDDDRTELLDELPAKTVKKLLMHLPKEEREIANLLLNYPKDSAGRIMTAEFVDLKADMTVKEALERIRKTARKKETIYTCFVIDNERKLIGVVKLEDLILADPSQKVKDIMETNFVSVHTHDDQEEVAKLMVHYHLDVVPVVDKENRLVGIITIDDVIDIIEEETTEDIQKMAAISPTEEPYLEVNPIKMSWKRIIWLFVCIATEAITSTVLKNYSAEIQRIVALTYFIPLLIGTGGNAGTQSATLIIRSFTLGEVREKDIPRVIIKEVITGLIIGIVLGILAMARALMLTDNILVALVVACSLIAVVILGNLAGAILPIIAKALKLDPAVMSGPFIATVVDVVGLIVYFEIARALLDLK